MNDYALRDQINDLQAKVQRLLVSKAVDEPDEQLILGLIDQNLVLMKALYQKVDILEERVDVSERTTGSSRKVKAKPSKGKKR